MSEWNADNEEEMWDCRVGDNALGRGTRFGKPDPVPETDSQWCEFCTLAECAACGILQYALYPTKERLHTVLSSIRAHLPDGEAILRGINWLSTSDMWAVHTFHSEMLWNWISHSFSEKKKERKQNLIIKFAELVWIL